MVQRRAGWLHYRTM